MSAEKTAAAQLDTARRSALSKAAWGVRSSAKVYGLTRVGCAVLADDDRIYAGCNIEHRFRSHDIHAEVNAISSLVAGSKSSRLLVVLIAAERNRFTPCGGCLDWIFEIGGGDCLVVSEKQTGVPAHEYYARELMPLYPS